MHPHTHTNNNQYKVVITIYDAITPVWEVEREAFSFNRVTKHCTVLGSSKNNGVGGA